jgi:hypothetical protein
MIKWLDRSPALARLLETLSTAMSRQRGLPVIIGILLVIISFVVQVINVFSGSPLLELVGIVSMHVGILSALVGLLLAEALGG